MNHITLAVQVAGPVRTETLMGRDFRVFPAVLVREQVLNNNLGPTFLPAEEIAASVDAWNGIPVVIRHPRSRGMPVSARSPEVLNARGAGFLFRSRFEKAALKADVFIDVSRAGEMEDTGDVVNQVDSGEIGELSTGFGTNLEKVEGTFGGKKFSAILRDIRPDHLALLPDEVGACSVSDGCGLGVNHAGDCQAENEEPVDPPHLGPPPSPEAVATDTAWQRFVATAARFLGLARGAENESDEDRRRTLSTALREQHGGEDRHVWVSDVFSDDGAVVFEVEVMDGGEGGGLFRSTYEIAEDGTVTFGDPEKVRRVSAYEPVANAAGDHQQEDNMNRTQMIAQLVAAGTLDEEALNKLSDCQLKALAGAGATPEPAENAEGQGDGWDRARQYREELEQLRRQTANAVQSEEKERAQLLDDVLYAKNRPWTDDEVKAMGINELRKVHAAVCPRANDFTGQGGPRASNLGPSLDFVQPIMDGHRGESVLDRKEAN